MSADIAGVTYELINCVNNRILALLVKDTHNIPIHILICTYMPYFSNNGSTQTDEYLECIDALHGIIDEHGDSAPIKILGDLNVQLPHKNKLKLNWHKSKGFNVHSRIMNDFIIGNNLTVADHLF